MTTTTEAPTSELSEYSPTAAALADLRQRFAGVVWDVPEMPSADLGPQHDG